MIYKDQAGELRKKMEQSNPAGLEETREDRDYDSILVSNLPPRSEVHGSKNKKKKKRNKKKRKIKYPLIRLLFVFFILLPFIIISIYAYFKMAPQPAGGNTGNFEELKLENHRNDDSILEDGIK